jgi:hypothetical protein
MGERTTRAPAEVLVELASELLLVLCPPRERRWRAAGGLLLFFSFEALDGEWELALPIAPT